MPYSKDAEERKREKARERARRYRERKRQAKEAEAAKVVRLPEPPPRDAKPTRHLWVTTGAAPGDVIGDWAESCLVVPFGRLRGKPFVIPAWQRDWLTAALAPNIGEAGLSVARKNGKSGLVAVLLLAHMVGPYKRPHWRGVVASETGALAKELRDAVASTAEASRIELDVRTSPTPGHILGPDNTKVDFLNAERASGHALGADMAVIDEAGLLRENKRGLWQALSSCLSGRDGRLLAISIRGNGPMFSELAARADDPDIHWTEYAPPSDCAIDDPAAWHAGNPGLGTIKSLVHMERRSRAVLATPLDQAHFRAEEMNAPGDPGTEPIVGRSEWLECVAYDREDLPDREGDAVVGIDLGSANSMSAFVAYWPWSGRMEVHGAFPDTPGLAARGQGDGYGDFYVLAEANGELKTYPRRDTPAADFLRDCLARLEGVTVACVGADRHRKEDLYQVLEEAGWQCPVVLRGVGRGAVADGSHDIRQFQRDVYSRRLRVWGTLLTHAVTESKIEYDPLNNARLDKQRFRSRIDALQAAVIACGLGARVRAGSGKMAVMIA